MDRSCAAGSACCDTSTGTRKACELIAPHSLSPYDCNDRNLVGDGSLGEGKIRCQGHSKAASPNDTADFNDFQTIAGAERPGCASSSSCCGTELEEGCSRNLVMHLQEGHEGFLSEGTQVNKDPGSCNGPECCSGKRNWSCCEEDPLIGTRAEAPPLELVIGGHALGWPLKEVEGPAESSAELGEHMLMLQETRQNGATEAQGPYLRGSSKQITVLDIRGLCCPTEASIVRQALLGLPGVVELDVNVVAKKASVNHDAMLTSSTQLVKALNERNLEANIHVEGATTLRKKKLPWWSAVCGLLLLVAYFKVVFDPLKYVALAAISIGVFPIALKSASGLRQCALDINTLMLCAVSGSVVVGDYLEAGTIVFLYSVATYLESQSMEKARCALEAIISLSPQTAVMAKSGQSIQVEAVPVGSLLAVKAGELIPIDAIIESGKSSVDESSLTGESIPVHKEPGMAVWAGTVNSSGYLRIVTTAVAKDSAVARMVKMVEEAQSRRSPQELLVESFAKYYTPAVLVAAILIVTLPLAAGTQNMKHWVHLALVLLVLACPCALVISTPVTTVCGTTTAARYGVVVKGGAHLETLGRLDTVAFDKTGTLTEGQFRLKHVLSVDGQDASKILYWIASVESKSSHPMASALVEYARQCGVEASGDVKDFATIAGEGVSATVDGRRVMIGNARMRRRLGGWNAEAAATLDKWAAEGGTTGCVAVDGEPCAIFSVADSERAEAAEALEQLHKLGVSVAMLTGDNRGAARAIAARFCPRMDLYWQLLPEEKVRVVEALKGGRGGRKRRAVTAMVGDGINDAPALAAADLGIAMGVAGSAAAMEVADVALMTNDLRQLARAVRIGRRCRRTFFQNLVLAVATKALVFALAVAGYPFLWLAVLADMGTSLAVVANSLRILERRGVQLPASKEGAAGSGECCNASAAGCSAACSGKTDVVGGDIELGVTCCQNLQLASPPCSGANPCSNARSALLPHPPASASHPCSGASCCSARGPLLSPPPINSSCCGEKGLLCSQAGDCQSPSPIRNTACCSAAAPCLPQAGDC